MSVAILHGDVRSVLATLPADHFDCVVTSPPYWGLRDYGVAGQIGLEPTLGEHLAVHDRCVPRGPARDEAAGHALAELRRLLRHDTEWSICCGHQGNRQ